jgi:hypothetical protein
MHRYKTWSAPMPTTAALAQLNSGTAILTALQVATPATRQLQIISWGYTLDDPPGADAEIELIETDVAATVTAHVASGVMPLVSGQPASLVTLGVAATGYNATAEGAITAVRVFDAISFSSTSAETAAAMAYTYQFMPDERPVIAASKFLRVRITTPTSALHMRCWVCWDE